MTLQEEGIDRAENDAMNLGCEDLPSDWCDNDEIAESEREEALEHLEYIEAIEDSIDNYTF